MRWRFKTLVGGASANSPPQALKRHQSSDSGGTTKVVPFPESSHVASDTNFDRSALIVKAVIVNEADCVHVPGGARYGKGTTSVVPPECYKVRGFSR